MMTAVKDNQRFMYEDLAAIGWRTVRRCETIDKGHGRVETRRCAVVDLTAPTWDGWCDLFGRRQAIRLERQRHTVKTGETTHEVTYGLTSLGGARQGPRNC